MATQCTDMQPVCRKAMVNYACCEDLPGVLLCWADSMDIIDEYEVCLNIAESAKGIREMSWIEFCAYKEELRKFVASLTFKDSPLTMRSRVGTILAS